MMATFDNEAVGTRTTGRRLDDNVFQSAEEAVLSNPASAAVLPGQTDFQAMPALMNGLPGKQHPTWVWQVARQPFAAALLAFATGALAAALLRFAINRRTR